VLRLEDALDGAVRAAHDAAIAGGGEPVGGEKRGERAALGVLVKEAAELIGGDERLVAGQDDDGALSPNRLAGGEHGRAGALPLDLLGDLDTVRKPLGNAITRPDDRDHPVGTGLPGGIDNPLHQWLARHPVKHLRSIRAHPSALAGGHDEDREWRGHERSRVPRHECSSRLRVTLVPAHPLANRVVADAVLAPNGQPSHVRQIRLELLIRGPRHLARLGARHT
jgi:hypothetical protein